MQALLGLLSLYALIPLGSGGAAAPMLLKSPPRAGPGRPSIVDDDTISLLPDDIDEPTEMGPCQAMATVRFWALWLIFGVTVGGDVLTLNILSSIVKSRGEDPDIASMCVIIVMAADTLSRFGSGFAVSAGASPGLLLCFGPLLMVIAQLMLATDRGPPLLYLACVVTGLSDGIVWSLAPLLTGRLFGLAAAGRNFGMIVLSAACFALLLSLGLEPAVYEAHREPGAAGCLGVECFALTHYVAAGLGGVGVAVSIHLKRQIAATSNPTVAPA